MTRFSHLLSLRAAFASLLGLALTGCFAASDDSANTPGTIEFNSATFAVQEPQTGTLVMSVTAHRINGNRGAVSITISDTLSGTAAVPVDYTAIPSQVFTWADGEEGDKTVSVTIQSDGVIEATKTIVLGLSGSAGGGVVGTGTATVLIADSPGTLQFTAAAFGGVGETGTTSRLITVSRTGGSGGVVGLTYADTTVAGAGKAISGTDYTAIPTGTLSWADGDTANKSYTFSAIADVLPEGAETADFLLSLPTGGATLVGQTTTQVTLSDSPGIVQFAATSFTRSEGGAVVNLSVTRTAGAGGTAVFSCTAGGSASNPSDYTTAPALPTNFTWLDGDSTAKPITVTIAANDLAPEGQESATFTLAVFSGADTLGTNSVATITLDDSPGIVQFAVTAFTRSEGGAVVSLSLTRTAGAGGTAVFSCTAGGSASNPSDYTTAPALPTNFTWLDGDAVAKPITVTIAANDLAPEGQEAATFTLALVSGADTLGGSSVATVTLNDSPGIVQFAATSFTRSEGGAVVNLSVTRTAGAGGTAVFSCTPGGSASNPLDYTTAPALPANLTWLDGDAVAKPITVTIAANDLAAEGQELATFTLAVFSGADTLGGSSVATVTLNDSPGIVQFAATSFTRSEGGAVVNLSVTRTAGAGGTAVFSCTPGGSASNPLDYTTAPALPSNLTWLDGDAVAKPITVTIAANDLAAEGQELATFTLAIFSGADTLGGNSVATVTLNDSPGIVQFAATSFTRTEGGAVVNLSVTRTAGAGGTAVFSCTPSGSASNPSDYTTVPALPTNLTWLDGDAVAKPITVTIAANDLAAEGQEAATFTLAVFSGADTLGGSSVATITLNDSPGIVQFAATSFTRTEGGAVVNLSVTRTQGAGGTAVFSCTPSGSASNPSDYTTAPVLPTNFTWLDGDAVAKPITVTIAANDLAAEGQELATFTLAVFSGADALGGNSAATITLNDSPGIVQFAVTSFTRTEGGAVVNLSVTRTQGAGGTAVFSCTPGGSASNPTDYTTAPVLPTNFTWLDGDAVAKPITVTIAANDLAAEGQEAATFTLAVFSGADTLGGGSVATITLNDSPGIVEFAATSFTRTEGGAVVNLSVTRTAGAGGTAVFSCTPGGSASSPTDYTTAPALPANLTWLDGDAVAKPITVTIAANDLAAEGQEAASFTLAVFSGADSLGGNSVATITLNDSPGIVQFAVTSFTRSEGGAVVNLSVTRTAGAGGTAVFSCTAGGSASNPTDYTTAPVLPTNFTWLDGDSVAKPITVTIAADDLASEGQEAATFTLAVFSGADTLGGGSVATVTIDDSPGIIIFKQAIFTGTEPLAGTANLAVTARRSNGRGPAVTVPVTQTAGSTATVGTDFVAFSGTVLSWNADEEGDKTFNITINSDSGLPGMEVGGEDINLGFGVPTGGATIGAGQPTAVGHINDGPGRLTFASATYGINEDDPGTVNLVVNRIDGSGGAITVDYAVNAASTAAAPANYVAIPNGTLNWADGIVGPKNIVLDPSDDTVPSGDKTVIIDISNPGNLAGTAAPTQTTATIVDVQSATPGDIDFVSADYARSEAGGVVTIALRRLNGTFGAVSVDVSDVTVLGPGKATAGSDYVAFVPQTVNWGNGIGGVQTFSFTIIDDYPGMVDDNESIDLTLINYTPGVGAGPNNAATVRIVDPPRIVSSAPALGAPSVSRGTNYEIVFTKQMDKPATEAAISLLPATAFPLQFFWNSPADTVVTVAFDTQAPLGIYGNDILLENQAYTLTVGAGAKEASLDGILIPAVSNRGFATPFDTTPPTILSISPSETAVIPAGTTNIDILFSEPMSTFNGRIQIRDRNDINIAQDQIDFPGPEVPDGLTGAQITWDVDQVTLHLVLFAPLPQGQAFEVSFDFIGDQNGNGLANDSSRRILVSRGAATDTIAPLLAGSFPADSLLPAVPRDTSIIAVFNEMMAPDLASHVGITGAGATLWDTEFSTSPPALAIKPRQAWPANQVITVTINGGLGGAKDTNNNPIATVSFSFTTNGGDATEMTIDEPFSTFLPNNATQVYSGRALDGSIFFRNLGTGFQAFPNVQTSSPVDVTVRELGSNIPIKGYTIDASRGTLELQNWQYGVFTGLKNGVAYRVTFNPSMQNSQGVALTVPQTRQFTTAPAGNTRPSLSGRPDMAYTTGDDDGVAPFTHEAELRIDASDFEDFPLTVTAVDNLDAGFTPGLPVNGFTTYKYQSPGNDPALATAGEHIATITVDDGALHTQSVSREVYIFPTPLGVTLTAPSGVDVVGSTPTFTWSAGIPVGTQGGGGLLQVKTPSGQVVYETGVSFDALLPGSFTVPADQPLPVGNYTWSLFAIHFNPEGAARFDSAASFATIGPATFSVDTPGELSLSTTVYNVLEDSPGFVTITVNRSNGTMGAVAVNLTDVISSTAVVGPNYAAFSPHQLSWADTEGGPKTFDIIILNDGVPTPTLTIDLAISGPTNGAVIGSPSTATVNIFDAQTPGTVHFQVANASINEGDPSGTYSVALDRTGGQGGSVSVDVTYTGGGTAVEGVDFDFVDLPPATYNWGSGDQSTQFFDIDVYPDALANGSRTIILQLANESPLGIIGTPSTFTLNINDLVGGNLEFSSPTYTVTEAGIQATISVNRVGASGGAIQVDYSASPGSASPGTDFTPTSAPPNLPLMWPDGDSLPKSFSVLVYTDGAPDGNKTVNLQISNPQGIGSGLSPGLDTAVLTITDDQGPGVLEFTSATYQIVEGSGPTFTANVKRTGGSGGVVSVQFSVADGSANSGPDFSVNPGFPPFLLVWSDTDSADKQIQITANGDFPTPDPNEDFTITLINPGGGASLGLTQVATITIVEPISISGYPSFGSNEVSLAADIVVNFNHGMNTATIDPFITLRRSPPGGPLVPIQLYWNAPTNDVLTIVTDPDNSGVITGDDLLLENTFYQLTIPALAQDSYGTSVSGPYAPTFHTRTDATPPTLASTFPDFAQVIPDGTTVFLLNFSEGMEPTQGDVRISAGFGDDIAQASVGSPSPEMAIDWNIADPKQLIITLTNPLPANATFRLDAQNFQDNPVSGFANSMPHNIEKVLVTQGFDHTSPTVSANLPANGDLNVSRDAAILVTFKESMDPDLVNHVTVVDGSGTPHDKELIDIGGVIITPRRAWALGPVTVTVDGGAKDASGNFIAAPYVFGFTVVATPLLEEAADMVLDTPFNTLKGSESDWNPNSVNFHFRFKNSVNQRRAYIDQATNVIGNISLIDTDTGIPAKGYLVEYTVESGEFEVHQDFNLGGVNMHQGANYVLTLGGILANSRGVPFTPAPLPFTTGLYSGGNNRPTLYGTPESQYTTTTGGTEASLRVNARDEDAGDETLTVTALDQTPDTFNPNLPLNGGPGSSDYGYEPHVAELPAVLGNTLGNHPIQYSITDPIGGHAILMQDQGFVFDKAALPGIIAGATPAGPQGVNTPPFSWNPVPLPQTGGLVLLIELHEIALPNDTAPVAQYLLSPADTTFSLQADRALPQPPVGWEYRWSLALFHLGDPGNNRFDTTPGFAMTDPVAFTTPASNLDFALNADNGTEGDAPHTITVNRTVSLGSAVSCDIIAQVGATATNPADYTLSIATLTWPAGVGGPQTFDLNIVDDQLPELAENVTFTLGNFQGGSQAGAGFQSLVFTINDNGDQGFEFDPGPYSASELDGSITINVNRVGNPIGVVSVDVLTEDDTATAGNDFVVIAPTQLQWANGDPNPIPVTVTFVNNPAVELTKQFRLKLQNNLPLAGTTIITPSINVSIDDEDTAVVCDVATLNGFENSGDVAIVVKRLGSTRGAIDVEVNTAPSGVTPATEGTDYTGIHAIAGVHWDAGTNMDKFITVPLTNDSPIVDPNETFTVTLSNPVLTLDVNSVTIGAPSATVVTIVDSGADSAAPFVVANVPNHLEIGVFTNRNITITFNEAMKASTINDTNIKVNTGLVAGVVSYDATTRTATFNPNSDLANSTTFVVNVAAAVEDLAGNQMGTPYVFQFDTTNTTDVNPPTIMLTSPYNTQPGVSPATNYMITFSEPMDRLSVEAAITVTAAALPDPGLFFFWSADSRNVTISFDTTAPFGNVESDDLLEPGTDYTMSIAGSYLDLAGISGAPDFKFFDTRADIVPPTFTVSPNPLTGVIPVVAGVATIFTVDFNEDVDQTGTLGNATEVRIDQPFGGGGPLPYASARADGSLVNHMTAVWGGGPLPARRLTFTVEADRLVPRAAYRFRIEKVRDLAQNYAPSGDNQDIAMVIGIAPAGDVTNPQVVGNVPAAGGGVSRDTTIVLSFSETMNPGTLAAAIQIADGGTNTPYTMYLRPEGVLQITPKTAWPNNQAITVTVKGTATDSAGNGLLGGDFSYIFTTANVVAPPAFQVDGAFSSFPAGQTDVNFNFLEWFLPFKDGLGNRVYLDGSTLAAEDVSLVDASTGITVKGYRLSINASGYLSLDQDNALFIQPLSPSTSYELRLMPTLRASLGQFYAGSAHPFDTAASGTGNPRPSVNDVPEGNFEATSGGIEAKELRLNAQDSDIVSVTVQDDVDAFNAALAGGGGSDYTYDSGGTPEAGVTTLGADHTLTYTITDGAVIPHVTTIKAKAYVFNPAALPAGIAPNAPGAGATPLFSWNALAGDQTQLALFIQGGGVQKIIILSKGATSYQLPADEALPVGGYGWALYIIRAGDPATNRNWGRFAGTAQTGVTGFSVP